MCFIRFVGAIQESPVCTAQSNFFQGGRFVKRPYEKDKKMYLICSQNKGIYFCLHNKKKHAVASCPRVSTPHFNKSAVCYVSTLTNIPNYRREYRFELRTHPIPTPQESFLLLFFKKEEKITPHKLILKKFKKAIDKIFRESYNIRVVKIFGGGK